MIDMGFEDGAISSIRRCKSVSHRYLWDKERVLGGINKNRSVQDVLKENSLGEVQCFTLDLITK